MQDVLINNRYLLESELGRGGMGIVYRAHDKLLEREVAVKVLWSGTLGSQGRARLLREAQAAARLNHPNIINIYDAGDSDGFSYIVMELLDGDSLFERKPKSLDEVLSILRQICDALDHAHKHGIIHRDLKPENVIVTEQGVAKLTDFGLSRSITSRVSQEGGIVGTVYYLAPEQALRQEVDERADLYALGVLMYELLAGRLPFTADDPLGVISQHLNASVIPPSTYNPTIPALLEALILQLLNKRPEDRPTSAAVVRTVLDNLDVAPQMNVPALVGLSPLDRLARGRIVGRQEEIKQIRALWRDIQVGFGQENVLVIMGESGVGKSPLIKEIRSLAEVSGARTLLGECYARGSAPYAPFVQLLRESLPLPEGLPDLVLSDLQGLVPDITARSLPLSPPLSPLSEQQRLFESMLALFATLCERQPLVLVVEDVQWADSNTLFLIRHLARRARATHLRMMLVITYRSDSVQSNNALRDILNDLRQEHLALSMELEPFTREQTRELLAVMFAQEINDTFLDAVFKVTEGNMFFIEEICKALIDEGKLYNDGGIWQFSGIGALELPQSVRLALQVRIDRLPAGAQELLRLASVIGREFDYEVLRLSCEQNSEDELIESLEQAQHAQLINELHVPRKNGLADSGERFAFVHGLIPATLRENISNLRRHRMHRRIALAVEKVHPEDHETLAYHFREAGDTEKTRHYTILAGDRARKLYANQEALQFYNDALQLSPEDHPDRFHILESRAQVYNVLAQRSDQRADIEGMMALAEHLDDDHLRCDALIALADLFLVTEEMLSQEPSRRAVQLAQKLQDPVREAKALRGLGWGAWIRHDYHESLSSLEKAAQHFRQSGMPSQAAECLHMLSLVTGMQGLGELEISRKYAEDAIQLSRIAGDPRQEAISLRRLAIVFYDQRETEHAFEITQQALKLHRELGDRYEECMALNSIGIIHTAMGKFDEAVKFIQQSLDTAIAIQSTMGTWIAYANLQWFLYRREGKYEESLVYAKEMLAQDFVDNSPFLSMNILRHKADILYRLGQYHASLEDLEEARKIAYHFGGPLVRMDQYLGMAMNHAELQDFTAARTALDEARNYAKKLERPNDAAVLLIIDAEISRREWEAGNMQQIARAQVNIEQAIALLRGTDWLNELAAALQTAGWTALARNQPGKALEHSQESMTLYAPYPVRPDGYEYVHVCALWANGQEDAAQEYLEQAYQRIMLIANQLQDEELRRSWLEDVYINRQIIRDWALYHT